MPGVDARIARILTKLAEVRERRIETFGSKAHRFALAAPLSEAEVRALETSHGIELPEAYRTFLIEAGASGAGPYYGIMPPAGWGDLLFGDVAMPDWAARPFGWTAETPRDDATWQQRSAGLDEPFQGAIAIADQGCANYAALVITGEERGRVVYVSLEGRVPFFPENTDFLSWYERWLDELSWGHTHVWFGFAMPGNEAALAAAASQAEGPRRAQALQAMFRLPALAPETAAIVATRVRDDDPVVRAVAIGVAAKFKLVPAIEAHVRRALTDDHVAVRQAALRAVIDSELPWHDDARRALGDPDDGIAAVALRALDKARVATVDEVIPLIGRVDGDVRTAALYAAMSIASPTLFDVLLPVARASGDDRHPLELLALLAQVRLGTATPAQQDIALELVLERLTRPTGKNGRTAEISALGRFVPTHPRALAALIELTRHPEPFHRYESITVLGDVGGPEVLEVLRAVTGDAAMPSMTTSSVKRSTSWSVGENARRALAKVEARIAKG